ncbi:Crp/Fnr family transcriptional regulator [Wenyingzhuangia sp. IMCC45574]
MSELQPFINLLQEFYPLTNKDVQCLAENTSIVTIKEKEVYLSLNSICKQMGFVLEGVFKVAKFNSQGDEYIPYFVTPGHFAVDVDSFFHQTNAEEEITALTFCKVVAISKSDYEVLEQEIPNFSKIIAAIKEKALVEKLKLKNEMLVDAAEVRFQKLMERQPQLFQFVPQSQIAKHLGITQYTLSRIKSKV